MGRAASVPFSRRHHAHKKVHWTDCATHGCPDFGVDQTSRAAPPSHRSRAGENHQMVVVIVVAAGLFIVGAPAPVLTYVRKERRPARRWLSDAVLRFSAARGAPLRGVQASVGRLSGIRCLACTGRLDGQFKPGAGLVGEAGRAGYILCVYIYCEGRRRGGRRRTVSFSLPPVFLSRREGKREGGEKKKEIR
jgi:hypothetical protein